MVIKMKNTKYDKIADNHKASEKRFKNAVVAFLMGGFIGFLGEVLIEVYCYYLNMSRIDSSSLMIVTFIFVASLCTALGFFDKLVNKFKCGLLIPITGFAHSIQSSALDYKKDGLITGMGANFFKLAGSVILYGIVSAFLFCILKVVFYG